MTVAEALAAIEKSVEGYRKEYPLVVDGKEVVGVSVRSTVIPNTRVTAVEIVFNTYRDPGEG